MRASDTTLLAIVETLSLIIGGTNRKQTTVEVDLTFCPPTVTFSSGYYIPRLMKMNSSLNMDMANRGKKCVTVTVIKDDAHQSLPIYLLSKHILFSD